MTENAIAIPISWTQRKASQRRFHASRASESASSPNGSQKKSSAIAPSCRSSVQASDRPVQAISAASGPGQRTELARAGVAADELEAEQHRRPRNDRVERQQQVRVGRADVHGDARRGAGKGADGDQPRPPAEQRGEPDRAERTDDDRRPVDLRVPARREVEGEERAADEPRGEPAHPQVAARRDEEERQAGAGDRPAGVGEVGPHLGLTITAARAAWSPARTTSVYRPGRPGARTTSRPGFAVPSAGAEAPAHRRVRRDLDAEPGPRLRLDPVTGERDVPEHDVDGLPGVGQVPGAILGGELKPVDARPEHLPVDAAVPLDRRALLLPPRVDDPLPVHEQDPVRRLVRLVGDDDAVAAAVAVRRELARRHRDDRDLRRGRVDPHLVRQVDRPVLVGQVDARLVDAFAARTRPGRRGRSRCR